MNSLINQAVKTMSSREIAALTNKRHDNVMRTINSLVNDNILTPQFEDTLNHQNGQSYKSALLNKRDSLVLVARLSPEFTAAIIDRWQELESSQPALPDFNNPVEAARAWANTKESEQQLLLEAKENEPKIDFYNQVTDSKDAVDMASAAKVLNIKGIGRNKLFSILRDSKVLQENNQPYQLHIDAGRFRVIESKFTKPNGDTHINIKTVVYQKGLSYILKLIKEL